MSLRRFCLESIAITCLIASVATGWAQSYPVKPVRYIVPASAGGGGDILGRIIAASLAHTFRQQVIVDNKPGAAGNIGAEIAAKAAPDGYTLFQMTVSHAVNVSLYRDLAFDLVRDFSPVTRLASSPLMVVVHPSLPAKSIAELVKLAKSRPGAINYASGGTGTPTFLAVELFKERAGIDLVHVPYKGGGGAQTSILAGETSVYFANIVTALSHVRQGKLRALAVTSPKRVPLLPEYPTIGESGYPGYQSETWFGLLVPVKTPKETIAVVRAAAISALNAPDVSQRLIDLAYIAVGDQPEEFAAFIQSEIATLGKLVRRLRVHAD